MAKKPCDCDSGKMTFEQWAAAGGAIPLSFKGREKSWANQVRKYAAGGSANSKGKAGDLSVLEMGDMSSPAYRAHLERKQGLEGSYPESFVAPAVRGAASAVKGFLGNLGKPKPGQLSPGHYEFANAKRDVAMSQLTKQEMDTFYRTGNLPSRFPELLENASVIGSKVGRVPMPKPEKKTLQERLVEEVMTPAGRRSAVDLGLNTANQMSDIYDQKGFAPAGGDKAGSYAAGGSVSSAAQIDGDEFVEAAKAYGLGTDNDTLNKIVARVNRGQSVREAARAVAQSQSSGEAKMQAGGIAKLAKLLKGTQETLPAAQREANLQKMLAESKAPMRLYHGTMATEGGKNQEAIRRIKPSREGALGSGVYLTPQSEFASTYAGFPARSQLERDIKTGSDFAKKSARQLIDRMDRGVVEPHEVGGNMLPVYAQIKNPLVLEGKGDPMIEALVKLGMDKDAAGRMVENAYERKGYIGKEVESRARAAGYDGLMQYRDGNLSEVVSYNPNAVKSATGNVGTFDVTKPDLSKAKGGEVKMAEGGDPSKPYIGYRRAGRRPESQQDREASANIPVAVARGLVSGSLGMPGDIESLARLPYELITGKESPTILPTSEDIEKRLPLRGASQTPVGQMFTGASQLAGGAYTGPGSGARAVMAVPRAIKRAGQDFVQAAGQPAVNVIKPKGGNFLTGSVEKAVAPLKSPTTAGETAAQRIPRHRALLEDPSVPPESRATVQRHLDEEIKRDAIDQWIDRNLANYVKKEMATPEDPVRRLAEQGIVHKQFHEIADPNSVLMQKRMGAGMPAKPMAQTEAGQFWENLADRAIDAYPAGSYKHGALDETLLERNPWLAKTPDETMIYSGKGLSRDLGFDHIVDVLKQDLAAGRIRPEQLNKVSMEQAVRRTYDFDQDMAKKMREAQIKATEGMPVHKEYPEGYKWVELTTPKELKLPEGWSLNHKKENDLYELINPDGQVVNSDYGAEGLALPKAVFGKKALEDALKYEGETMGHCVGGYCPDVLAGRSRIYSLRDARGEPHVTVEVEPAPKIGFREGEGPKTPEEKFDQQTEWMKGVESGRIGGDVTFAAWWRQKHGIPEPENPPQISQIKGKQNRAPKEEYLPFVQDFVRGGQWSKVGDFQNTGLIRKSDLIDKFGPDELDAIGKGEYLTKGEYDDLLLKALKPEDGMKAGGEVKMAGGGITKALKRLVAPSAEAAAKEASAAERAAAGRMAADVTKATQPMKMSEALGNLNVEGKGKLKVTQSDRTRVGGGNIGGAMFPGLSQVDPLYEGLVWGVGKKPTASSLINQSDDLTYWSTLLGAEDQLKTNPLVFNKLRKGFVDAMKQGKLSPELEEKINKNLALTFGEGAEIRDPKIWQKANTFDKRAALADVMLGQGIPPGKGGVALGGEKSGKGVIFKPTDILKRETEPLLLHPEHGGDVPTFGVGPRLFQFSGGMKVRPDLHPGFPVLLEGQDMGMVFKPAPGEIAMRDFANRMLTERGRKPGYYEWTMGESGKGLPSQLITDEYLTYLQKAGYKKGGKVGGLSQAKNQRKK